MNNADVDTHVPTFVGTQVFNSLGCIPGHRINIWGTAGLFSKTANHFTILPAQSDFLKKAFNWDDPEGWDGEGGKRGGSRQGTHAHPWLIHVNVWQKPLQHCKVI